MQVVITEDMRKSPRIFILGLLGSDRLGIAKDLAARLSCESELSCKTSYKAISLDTYIEETDGRSIKRICMTMGEHEYRNKEFEALQAIIQGEDSAQGLVVACGDGILLDEMCEELLRKEFTIFLDPPPASLWEAAKNDTSIPYAFMYEPDLEKRQAKFEELYNIRRPIYLKAARQVVVPIKPERN